MRDELSLLINAPKAAFIFGIRYTYTGTVIYIDSMCFQRRSFRDYEKNGLSVAGPRLYTKKCMKVFEHIPNLS